VDLGFYDRALARRGSLARQTEVLRVVAGAADDARDLIVDRYGPVVRVERYAEGVDAVGIAAALVEQGRAAGAVAWARRERGEAELLGCFGEVPAAHVVHEDGARFLVRTRTPDAVGAGIFADHREGRRAVRARARGARVLNLFAHAGAFGVAALTGGAARVDQVDLARKCARWAATNLALNGADPRRHRFLVEDALRYLPKAARRAREGAGYEMVILDPPTTARTKRGRFVLERSLGDLARDAVGALASSGWVLFSCNARGITRADIARALREGARERGARVDEVTDIAPGEDFPAGADMPMRGVLAHVRAFARVSA
jgi:23S rRNA G2069 N7-methylase RlmK/C1962 C5-methylase RlmI